MSATLMGFRSDGDVAVTGYYFGRSLGPMRISEDAGELRGEAKVFPGERGEFCILAAGRACAEAFDLHQHPKDYAIDYAKLDELLTKDIPGAHRLVDDEVLADRGSPAGRIRQQALLDDTADRIQ